MKKEDFLRLLDIFFRHLQRSTGGLLTRPETTQLRSTLDVLREALEDVPPEDLQDASYEPCRYKLIIDETEDGGAVRMLQAAQLLPEQWEFLEVSDLPGDRNDLHRSQMVSNLRRAAEQARTCVMIAYDEILDDFWVVLSWTDFLYSIPDSIATKKWFPAEQHHNTKPLKSSPKVLFATGCRLVTCPC